MTTKINPKDIWLGHLSTLVNATTKKTSIIDVMVFYGIPFILMIVAWYMAADVTKEIINVLINCSAIFIGLLLNLLVLVYDQKSRCDDPADVDAWEASAGRRQLLHELYYNISYAILVAIFILLVSLVHVATKKLNIDPLTFGKYQDFDFDFSSSITTPLIVFFGLNFLLTLLMVLKRFHVLLTTER